MRKLFLCSVLFAAGLAFADTTPPPGPGQPAPAKWVLATIDRTPCYGSCPSYRVTVSSDGRVTWYGQSHVKTMGQATATLTGAQLKALRAAFEAAHYLDLTDDFACREVTDHPWVHTSFSDGKREKKIRHYHGCSSKPDRAHLEALNTLEGEIDRIVGTARWIGTNEERRNESPARSPPPRYRARLTVVRAARSPARRVATSVRR